MLIADIGEALETCKPQHCAAAIHLDALCPAICTLGVPHDSSCFLAPLQSVGKTAGIVAMGVAAGALMSALTVDVAEMADMGAGGLT